ncbi:MAG TPA: DUF3159 domain-containing protein [Acidimicrobiia bacterium]|nr:DUF3159 domain-containing protein [Acidimicrobiia bacterium]
MPDTSEIRAELRQVLFGRVALVDGIAPPLVFVAVNAIWGVFPAAFAGVVSAIAITLWRLSMGRPLRFALAGLAGVGVATALALRSGDAEDFFLPGIATGTLTSLVILGSILVRRPFVAWTSWLTRGWPLEWYWHPQVRPAYTLTSWIWLGYFVARTFLQWQLYSAGDTEGLAVARVLLGWPGLLLLLIATYVLGRRRLDALAGPSVAEFESGQERPWAGQRSGF